MARDPKELNDRPVFMIGHMASGAALLIGIPDACRQKLVDGNSHAIDLTKVGIDLRILIYGADDHDAAIKVLEQHARENNIPFVDERRKDFGL